MLSKQLFLPWVWSAHLLCGWVRWLSQRLRSWTWHCELLHKEINIISNTSIHCMCRWIYTSCVFVSHTVLLLTNTLYPTLSKQSMNIINTYTNIAQATILTHSGSTHAHHREALLLTPIGTPVQWTPSQSQELSCQPKENGLEINIFCSYKTGSN